MRPWFVIALLASLALTGWAVWWPAPEAADGLLPARRTAGTAAVGALPAPTDRAAGPAQAAARPDGRSLAAAARPADSAAAVAPAEAHRRQDAPAAADRPFTLPTRPADWPTPSARSLAAWQGPPPPQAAEPVPAGPAASAVAAAPVFPYQWIGQLDDGGPPQVLLASAQRSVGVRQGAVLDGRWRLERAPGQPWQALHLPSGRSVEVRGAPAGTAP